jgi:hypothetical protein
MGRDIVLQNLYYWRRKFDTGILCKLKENLRSMKILEGGNTPLHTGKYRSVFWM